MAKVKLDFGAEFEVLTQGELDDSLCRSYDRAALAMVRGIRYRRLPILSGAAVSGVLTLGVTAPESGPDSGFAWSLRRIFVNGLTGGATPDVVQLFRNGGGEQPMWQISGASPGQTFGRLEAVLLGGETLVVASSGTFAATGQITVSGELIEVPSEMLPKLA